MRVVVEFEKGENTLVFHPAHQEMKITLAVLDAIRDRVVILL